MGEKKKGPRQFSREFKLRAVERMQAGESPSALQRELENWENWGQATD